MGNQIFAAAVFLYEKNKAAEGESRIDKGQRKSGMPADKICISKTNMLILTRKLNEAIQIGDDIRIIILDIGNSRVKIGIEAPKETKIQRIGLFGEIRKFNQEAAEASSIHVKQGMISSDGKKPEP